MVHVFIEGYVLITGLCLQKLQDTCYFDRWSHPCSSYTLEAIKNLSPSLSNTHTCEREKSDRYEQLHKDQFTNHYFTSFYTFESFSFFFSLLLPLHLILTFFSFHFMSHNFTLDYISFSSSFFFHPLSLSRHDLFY